MVDLIVDAKCIEERTEPMSTSSHVDRWLLPRRQTEFPLRDLLPEATLHARRELTFLALAVLAVLPAAFVVLVGASNVVDLSAIVSRALPDVELPLALVLPLGVAPFALGLIAVGIAGELFGRRRAFALACAAALSAVALAGCVRAQDVLIGGDAFAGALALAAAAAVAMLVHVLVLDGLRRSLHGRAVFVRLVVASLVACALGFAAYAGVTYQLVPVSNDAILSAAAGSAVWTFALSFVLAIAAAIAVRLLSVALRVGRELDTEIEPADDLLDDRPQFVRPVVRRAVPAAFDSTQLAPVNDDAVARTTRPARAMPAVSVTTSLAEGSVSRSLPAAEIIDEDVVPLEPKAARRRPVRASLQPFSSAEMAFFAEGDELETAH